MGAPPGWGPNWKENQEKARYAASQREAEKAQREAAEEERGYDIFKSGDLVKNAVNDKTGVVIEPRFRDWVLVFVEGKDVHWPRKRIEVISES